MNTRTRNLLGVLLLFGVGAWALTPNQSCPTPSFGEADATETTKDMMVTGLDAGQKLQRGPGVPAIRIVDDWKMEVLTEPALSRDDSILAVVFDSSGGIRLGMLGMEPGPNGAQGNLFAKPPEPVTPQLGYVITHMTINVDQDGMASVRGHQHLYTPDETKSPGTVQSDPKVTRLAGHGGLWKAK